MKRFYFVALILCILIISSNTTAQQQQMEQQVDNNQPDLLRKNIAYDNSGNKMYIVANKGSFSLYNQIEVWDTHTNQIIETIEIESISPDIIKNDIRNIKISKDNRYILLDLTYQIVVLNSSFDLYRIIDYNSTRINSVNFHSQNSSLVDLVLDNNAQSFITFNIIDNAEEERIEFKVGDIVQTTRNVDDTLIAILVRVSPYRVVFLYNCSNSNTTELYNPHLDNLTSIEWHPFNNTLLLNGRWEKFTLIDVENNNNKTYTRNYYYTPGFRFNFDGTLLGAVQYDTDESRGGENRFGKLIVWNIKNEEMTYEYEFLGWHYGEDLFDLRWHPKENTITAVAEFEYKDGILVWNVDQGIAIYYQDIGFVSSTRRTPLELVYCIFAIAVIRRKYYQKR